MNNTALYIQADPFTFNHLDLVRKCIRSFGFIHIMLDRKNRDAEYDSYTLSYQDRADIIKHDLKENKIEQFDIIPVDSTVQKIIKQYGIDTIVLNYSCQCDTNFKLFKILTEINKDVQIMLLKADNYIEEQFIKTLIDSDETMNLYKKYCSDYAYCRLKLRSMYKIGLTGNSKEGMDRVQKVFESRDLKVVDVEEFLETLDKDTLENEKRMYAEVNRYIAQQIIGYFNTKIVIRGKKFFEYAMEKFFDCVICAKDVELFRDDDSMMPISEKCGLADYCIDCSKEDAENGVISLFNKKFSKI